LSFLNRKNPISYPENIGFFALPPTLARLR
jgi:hypothetical protein